MCRCLEEEYYIGSYFAETHIGISPKPTFVFAFLKYGPPDGSVSSQQTNNQQTYCAIAPDKTDFEILRLCVTGEDHLICDGRVSAWCWNKPQVLLVSSLLSTLWNLTHWTASAETKQKGFWKLGAAFVSTVQKSNNGLGSRQPRSHFLCTGTLPLQLLQGRGFTNRQAGHLTTTERSSEKGHSTSNTSDILYCDVFLLLGNRIVTPHFQEAAHRPRLLCFHTTYGTHHSAFLQMSFVPCNFFTITPFRIMGVLDHTSTTVWRKKKACNLPTCRWRTLKQNIALLSLLNQNYFSYCLIQIVTSSSRKLTSNTWPTHSTQGRDPISWPPQGGQHSQDTRAHHGYHQPALCSNSSCGSVLFNTQICALNNQIGIITHILQRGKQSQQCKATRRCSSCNQRQKAEKAQGAMCTASIAVPLCCLPGRAQQLRPARLLAGTCFKEPLAPCPVFKDMALV